MKIAIGTDHRGREKKLKVIEILKSKYEVLDKSVTNTDTDDYPDFAYSVSKSVIDGEADFGILICGTRIGMSIAANKVKGIRCALIHSKEEAKLAKEHNGANVLAFGENVPTETILDSVDAYINACELGEQHARRREKIIKIENGEYVEL